MIPMARPRFPKRCLSLELLNHIFIVACSSVFELRTNPRQSDPVIEHHREDSVFLATLGEIRPIAAYGSVGTAIMICRVAFQSMMADTADEHEARYKVNSEGS